LAVKFFIPNPIFQARYSAFLISALRLKNWIRLKVYTQSAFAIAQVKFIHNCFAHVNKPSCGKPIGRAFCPPIIFRVIHEKFEKMSEQSSPLNVHTNAAYRS